MHHLLLSTIQGVCILNNGPHWIPPLYKDCNYIIIIDKKWQQQTSIEINCEKNLVASGLFHIGKVGFYFLSSHPDHLTQMLRDLFDLHFFILLDVIVNSLS